MANVLEQGGARAGKNQWLRKRVERVTIKTFCEQFLYVIVSPVGTDSCTLFVYMLFQSLSNQLLVYLSSSFSPCCDYGSIGRQDWGEKAMRHFRRVGHAI
jgi:hypothetical protein